MFSCPRPAETSSIQYTYSKRARAQPTHEQYAGGHDEALQRAVYSTNG